MGMKRTPNDISKEEGQRHGEVKGHRKETAWSETDPRMALRSSLLKNQNQNLLPSGPNRLKLLFCFPGL